MAQGNSPAQPWAFRISQEPTVVTISIATVSIIGRPQAKRTGYHWLLLNPPRTSEENPMIEPLSRAGAVMLGALLLSAPSAIAQGLKVGDPAPAIALDTWLNLSAKQKPTLKNVQGKAVLIEFWGTW